MDIYCRLTCLVFYILALFCMIIELSCINIGFDFSDEGWLLSKLRFPYEVKASITRDHLYSSFPFSILNYSIVKLRIFNILLLVFSAFILSLGLNNFLKQNFIRFISVKLLLCAILIFQLPSLWIERLPGYNNLSSFTAFILIGSTLIYYKNERKYSILPFFIGFIIALSLIIRPPSGLSLLFIFFLLSYCLGYNNLKFFRQIIIGLTSLLIFHFLVIEDLSLFYETTVNGFTFHTYLSRQPDFIIFRYLNEIWGNLLFCILANKYIIFTFIILYYLSVKYRIKFIVNALFTIFFIYIIYKHITFNDLKGAHGLYWSLWRLLISQFIFIFAFLFFHTIITPISYQSNFSKKIFFLPLTLLSAPILLSLGTSNIIMFNMNFYTSLFYIGIIITILIFQKHYALPLNNYNLLNLILLFSICSASAHYDGRINSPFYTICEESNGLRNQHLEFIESGGDKLMVNETTKQIFQNGNRVLDNSKLNFTYLLNFSGMPGLNFLFDIPHPFQSWTVHMENNFTLKNISFDTFQESALIFNQNNNILLDQLNLYFPNWKNTHIFKDNIQYKVNSKKKYLSLYVPL